jgi:hypothetical protein
MLGNGAMEREGGERAYNPGLNYIRICPFRSLYIPHETLSSDEVGYPARE